MQELNKCPFLSYFVCVLFIFRKGEARQKLGLVDFHTGAAGPRSEARVPLPSGVLLPRREATAWCTGASGKGLREGGARQENAGVSAQPLPGLPPGSFGKGGSRKGERRACGPGLTAPRASPAPAPLRELYTRIPSGSSSAGSPAARSHRSEPAEARAPRDVTRGAVKGRGPRSPQPPRRGFACAGRRLASNPGRGVPRGSAMKGRRGGNNPAGGERQEGGRGTKPEGIARTLNPAPRRP